ncbi:Uncharacterised protein [Acinetobacter baumannii]|nr:Uncharacterised protein [Acinetobacter baumannii]
MRLRIAALQEQRRIAHLIVEGQYLPHRAYLAQAAGFQAGGTHHGVVRLPRLGRRCPGRRRTEQQADQRSRYHPRHCAPRIAGNRQEKRSPRDHSGN